LPKSGKKTAAGGSAEGVAPKRTKKAATKDVASKEVAGNEAAGNKAGVAPEAQPAETKVSLGADLRIGRAREVHQALTQTKTATLIVDGEEVAKVDAAGLQSVLAALVHSRTAGVEWRWHNPSLALKSAAQLMGLDGALELT
jgi:anti-anti-sigma regulatory factor